MMELLFGLGTVWFVGLVLSVVLGCLAAVVASQKNLAVPGIAYFPGCLCCGLIGVGFLALVPLVVTCCARPLPCHRRRAGRCWEDFHRDDTVECVGGCGNPLYPPCQEDRKKASLDKGGLILTPLLSWLRK